MKTTRTKDAPAVDFDALLAAAALAEPLVKPRQSAARKWGKHYPAFAMLMRRGHSAVSAVEWMVKQGAVDPKEKRRAFLSLLAKWRREERNQGDQEDGKDQAL